MKETMESLKNEIKEEEEGYLILGDFNARTKRADRKRRKKGRGGKEIKRQDDKQIGREGRIMINDKGKRMDDSKWKL